MVVCHLRTVFFREERTETQPVGCIPDFLDLRRSRALRELLTVESSSPAPYHIKQDAKACIIALHMRHPCPILRTEAPGVGLVFAAVERRDSIIFCIKEHNIHTDGRSLLLHLAGDFEQDSHPACPVVGTEDRLFLFLPAALGVGVRAAVPVGAEQHTPTAVGVEGTDDVAGFQHGVIVGHQVGFLHIDLGTELLQLGNEIIAAGTMGSRIGHTRTEVYLLFHITVGAVGMKDRHLYRRLPCGSHLFGSSCLLTLVAARHNGYDQHQGGSYQRIVSFHNGYFYFIYLKLSFTSFFSTSSTTSAPSTSGRLWVTCPTGKLKQTG